MRWGGPGRDPGSGPYVRPQPLPQIGMFRSARSTLGPAESCRRVSADDAREPKRAMRKRGSIHKRVLQLIGTQAILLSAGLAWADASQLAVPNHVRDVKVRTTDAQSGAAEI